MASSALFFAVTFGLFFVSVCPGSSSVAGCHKYIENCFYGVSANLQCHMKAVVTIADDCRLKDAGDMCLSLDDAINCTRSIVSWGCAGAAAEGSFGAWTDGLEAIRDRLCADPEYALINALINNVNCWNPGIFLTCTEEEAKVTHVADLLATPLDVEECSRIMMAVAVCNAKAEKDRYMCQGTSEAVTVALTSFFAKSSCMSQITQKMLTGYCAAQISHRVAISVLVTIVVLGVTGAVAAVLLIKTRVLTLTRSSVRFYNEDGKDGTQD